MVLLRRVIGDALRARRQGQHRTLREVSTAANVSLGYLSEIERGQKEASSELLAAICEALGARLSELLGEVSDTLSLAEGMDGVLVPVGKGHAGQPAAKRRSRARSPPTGTSPSRSARIRRSRRRCTPPASRSAKWCTPPRHLPSEPGRVAVTRRLRPLYRRSSLSASGIDPEADAGVASKPGGDPEIPRRSRDAGGAELTRWDSRAIVDALDPRRWRRQTERH